MASAARKAYIRATGRIENAMSDLEEEGGQVAVASVASWFLQEEDYVPTEALRAEVARREQARSGSLVGSNVPPLDAGHAKAAQDGDADKPSVLRDPAAETARKAGAK
jgi:hypothetical protein